MLGSSEWWWTRDNTSDLREAIQTRLLQETAGTDAPPAQHFGDAHESRAKQHDRGGLGRGLVLPRDGGVHEDGAVAECTGVEGQIVSKVERERTFLNLGR